MTAFLQKVSERKREGRVPAAGAMNPAGRNYRPHDCFGVALVSGALADLLEEAHQGRRAKAGRDERITCLMSLVASCDPPSSCDRRARRAGACLLAALAAMLAILAPRAADAHPHVFVTTREVVVFDAEGRVAAVKNAWTFDEQNSAFPPSRGQPRARRRYFIARRLPDYKTNTEGLVGR